MDIDTLSSVLVGLMDDLCTVLCVLYAVYVSLCMFPLEMEILWCSRRPDVIISDTPELLPRTRFWVFRRRFILTEINFCRHSSTGFLFY